MGAVDAEDGADRDGRVDVAACAATQGRRGRGGGGAAGERFTAGKACAMRTSKSRGGGAGWTPSLLWSSYAVRAASGQARNVVWSKQVAGRRGGEALSGGHRLPDQPGSVEGIEHRHVVPAVLALDVDRVVLLLGAEEGLAPPRASRLKLRGPLSV